MAETATLRNTGDAYVSNKTELQDKNFSGTQKLYVKQNNPDQRWAYLYFGAPFPLGARGIKVIRAYIELHNGTAIEGGATLTVQRISEKWKRNRITWKNKPAVAGAQFSVTKSSTAPEGTAWRVNITNMMQAVADGQSWFGVRFTMNDGKGEWFHGSASKRTSLRPVIVVEYVDNPEIPTNLSPSNGNAVTQEKPLLRWDWTDARGSSAISYVRVQVAPGADMLGAWDSGWVPATVAELDLATTGYPGLAVGSGAYWRAYVRNAAGVESLPSDVAYFTRKAQSVPFITNPGGSEPDAYVTENTPPILWTFPGNQVHWQAVIFDPNDSNRIVADSKKVTGTEDGWTPPEKTKLVVGNEYTVEVRIWDDEKREANGDVPVYSFARKTFKVVFQSSVTPVSQLRVTQVTPYHWSKISWVRGTAADFYEIYANDVLMAKLPASDIDITGGISSAVIRTAPPRSDVTWKVVAVVNGVGSLDNPTVTKNFKARSAVLSETDGTNPIMFLNYSKDQSDSRQQTIHDVVGNYPPVLIKQALGGREGSFVGIISGNAVPNVSVATEKERWLKLDRNEGRRLLLTVLDESFECYIADGVIQSFADAEGLYYEISFDYYEMEPR